MDLAGGELVGPQNRHHTFDAGEELKLGKIVLAALLAHAGYHGALDAIYLMGLKSSLFDPFDHRRNLRRGGMRFHHYNHGLLPSFFIGLRLAPRSRANPKKSQRHRPIPAGLVTCD